MKCATVSPDIYFNHLYKKFCHITCTLHRLINRTLFMNSVFTFLTEWYNVFFTAYNGTQKQKPFSIIHFIQKINLAYKIL